MVEGIKCFGIGEIRKCEVRKRWKMKKGLKEWKIRIVNILKRKRNEIMEWRLKIRKKRDEKKESRKCERKNNKEWKI